MFNHLGQRECIFTFINIKWTEIFYILGYRERNHWYPWEFSQNRYLRLLLKFYRSLIYMENGGIYKRILWMEEIAEPSFSGVFPLL